MTVFSFCCWYYKGMCPISDGMLIGCGMEFLQVGSSALCSCQDQYFGVLESSPPLTLSQSLVMVEIFIHFLQELSDCCISFWILIEFLC